MDCGSIQPPEQASPARRFAYIAAELHRVIDRAAPDLIGVEQGITSLAGKKAPDPNDMFGGQKFQSIRNHESVVAQAGVRGIALAIIGARRPSRGYPDGIPYVEIAAATWRKGILGTSRAPAHVDRKHTARWLKTEVRARLTPLAEQLGFSISNTDESDACGGVLHMAAQKGLYAMIGQRTLAI